MGFSRGHLMRGAFPPSIGFRVFSSGGSILGRVMDDRVTRRVRTRRIMPSSQKSHSSGSLPSVVKREDDATREWASLFPLLSFLPHFFFD